MYAAKSANAHHWKAYAVLRHDIPPLASVGGGTRCTAGDATDVTSGTSAMAKTKALYSAPGQRLTSRERSRAVIWPSGKAVPAGDVSWAGDSPGVRAPDTVTSPATLGAAACAGSVTNPRTTAIRAPVDRTTNGVTTQYPRWPRSRRGVTSTCADPSYRPVAVIRRPLPSWGKGVCGVRTAAMSATGRVGAARSCSARPMSRATLSCQSPSSPKLTMTATTNANNPSHRGFTAVRSTGSGYFTKVGSRSPARPTAVNSLDPTGLTNTVRGAMQRLPYPDPGTPDLRTPLRFLRWVARGQWRTLLFGIFFGVIWMVSQALFPAAVGQAIDLGIIANNPHVLLIWGAVLVALGAISALA